MSLLIKHPLPETDALQSALNSKKSEFHQLEFSAPVDRENKALYSIKARFFFQWEQ